MASKLWTLTIVATCTATQAPKLSWEMTGTRCEWLSEYSCKQVGKTDPLATLYYLQHLFNWQPWPTDILSSWQPCPAGNPVPPATLSHWQPCPAGNSVPLATLSRWQPWPTGNPVPLATLSRLQHLSCWQSLFPLAFPISLASPVPLPSPNVAATSFWGTGTTGKACADLKVLPGGAGRAGERGYGRAGGLGGGRFSKQVLKQVSGVGNAIRETPSAF